MCSEAAAGSGTGKALMDCKRIAQNADERRCGPAEQLGLHDGAASVRLQGAAGGGPGHAGGESIRPGDAQVAGGAAGEGGLRAQMCGCECGGYTALSPLAMPWRPGGTVEWQPVGSVQIDGGSGEERCGAHGRENADRGRQQRMQ